MDKIENLVSIFPQDIKNTHTLISYKIESFTAAGDNYGSEVQLVSLRLKSIINGSIKEKKVVAKRAPQNEFVKKLFNTPVTFRKEVLFYQEVIPVLKKFQKDCNVQDLLSFFPKYYGGRLSLNSSKEADNDAIFLLENLKINGFRNENRFDGFNIQSSIVILECLAIMHGTVLALKIKQPELFKEIVMSVLEYPFAEVPLNETQMKKLLDDIINAGISVDPKLNEKADEIYNKLMKSMKFRYNPSKPNELFATMCHNDFWVNNIMTKTNRDGVISDCKILDFQITQYGSPAKDVFFFLMSSVERDIIENNFESLTEVYYQKFIEVLERFSCDTSQFSYKLFEEEINRVVQEDEFYHLMVMLKPIFADNAKGEQVKDYDINNLLSNDVESELYCEQVAYTINKLYERKLI